MINNKQNLIVAQSGQQQFMYLRTAETPGSVDYSVLSNSQNVRISELMDEGLDFSAASKQAAVETAKENGLAYYEGTGGIFNRVVP
jgi:type VI secretion system secreted protein VgrG